MNIPIRKAQVEFIEEGRLKKRIKIGQYCYIDDVLMALHMHTSED